MSQNALSLKVLEAYTRDVGRGVARIDYDSMDTLNASTGDVIEIKGKRRTVAKCLPLYPSDEGKGIIRIDGLGRNNSGIAIGDTISVRKIKAVAAEKIVVAPLEAIPPIDERYLADALESVPLIKGDNVMVPYFGGRLTFQVIGVTPAADAVLVTQKTIFHIAEKGETLRGVPQVTYEDIGGLTDEIKKVREMIELPLRHPEIFEKLGIEAPKGVLLYGPPGTGKTLLAKAVANESNAHFISISGPEIMSKFYGESEARLREIFKEAREKSPSIIFIDEIDSIAPKREEVTGEVERRVVSQMLSLMDGLEARGKVIVIAATNRPNAIDPALRRPGRFDREIEIGIPDDEGRFDILSIHTRGMPIDKNVDLEQISKITHGFVGADLEVLSKEAAMRSLRRILPEIDLDEEKVSSEILQKIQITSEDFRDALKEVKPSALREVQVQIPNVSWDDVGGLDQLKEELREAVEWPIKYKEAFDYVNVESPKGILLHGPPGTGKTMLAIEIAQSLGLPLIEWHIKSTTKAKQGLYEYDAVTRLRDSQLGDERVKDIANYIEKGKLWEAFSSEERVVLLVDEVDKADIEFPNDLLQELDRMEFFIYETKETIKAIHRPIVIITSNNEKELPDAFLRRCFFHYISFPDRKTMLEIVAVHHPKIKKRLVKDALDIFFDVRKVPGLRKKPSTSELIDWLKLLMADDLPDEILKNRDPSKAIPPLYGALIKNEQDVQLLERLAFMARREAHNQQQ